MEQHSTDSSTLRRRRGGATAADTKAPPAPRRQRRRGSVIVKHVWPYYIWFEGTFSLAMLEFWEKCLFFAIFSALTLLVSYYLVFHLAANARFILKRTMYYLFG
ncbi:hypothetical protein FA10DRAFT_288688 [Acaromyces ingoldii]|uniref:Small subunit of serine palmitoyltransferase-like protein n=1 Tax=Acaromyces ingoldii TaxID=215250 RepID=A0A316YJU3_9BASI|nr:hypothetical protein FA10DRAFT_288688 [Acaromyces ingoldii]PWN87995.1 hypothetical protein FA10DRAFT_288688 [Acaromyces ingoldii]